MRRRLDVELLRRGLVSSRTEGQRAIAAGLVTVAGALTSNAGRLVDAGEPVLILAPPSRFVSRGGEKLEAALQRFSLEVSGRRALDAGASTGGFTDCLLQHGVAHVVAVDVGHGQLHPRIRSDVRVTVFERLNVRTLEPEHIGGPVDVVVADLSFISLTSVLGALLRCCHPEGDLVLLVKPQFEAGRVEVSKGRGVITSPAVWARARDRVAGSLSSHGAAIMGWMESPVRGADGNVEFLVRARASSGNPA